MFVMLLIQNLLYLNSMELLGCHFQVEMHMNKQHYQLKLLEKDPC